MIVEILSVKYVNEKLNKLQIQQINLSRMEKPINQTKHAKQLGNIAIVYASHVFSIAKFDLFLTCITI